MADLVAIKQGPDGRWRATYAGESRGPFVEAPRKIDASDHRPPAPPVGVTPQGPNFRAELWEVDSQRFTAIERYALSIAGPREFMAGFLIDGEHLHG